MKTKLSRRSLLAAIAASPILTAQFSTPLLAAEDTLGPKQGRLKQSIMRSVWGNLNLSFEEQCEILSQMGFSGIDLPQPSQVPIMRDFGLAPTMMVGTGTTFADGLIRTELHDQIEEACIVGIDACAEAGCPNLIALPGERRGMSREEGADHAVTILSRIAPYAEEKGVVLCMENNNSKVASDNRTDQVFDQIEWGFDVCRRTGSPNVKVVFDIYHAQISDGDIVRHLRDNLDVICHIHVAGVPSRAEIDGTQELNYRFIAREIADMGYEGFVAHEFRPAEGRNPLVSLATAYDILTV